MTEKQKYDKVFIDSFSLQESDLGESLVFNQTPSWDSIGHMTMIAALEEVFGISMETDDIINFSSYSKGVEIMGKYGVKV